MRKALPVFLAATLILSPVLAQARAGGGSSMGSRGSRTYSAPRSTPVAPYAAPMERSYTAPSRPSYNSPPGIRPMQPAMSRRSAFTSGLLGGLIGAGIGGLLMGHGLFGGISGIFSFFGLLLQIFLIVVVVRFLWRRFAGGNAPAMAPAGAGLTNPFTGNQADRGPMGGGQGSIQPIQLSQADYQRFESLLKEVQAAWTDRNLQQLGNISTPEMVGYFNEQLTALASRGLHNTVTNVTLQKGDLSEAWREGALEYATVAMRFSMIDATYDSSGRVVEGDASQPQIATEFWTFVRSPGGPWILSAIQQTR
ncbi:TIM44-like domain-containing protein [Granulibacter bethesdensis]|nr:TIM44-like domain-containing protein [Granulibacter bethesdensis]